MAFTTKDLTGAAFPNEKENDRQPDFNGSVIVEGKAYWVAIWNKEAKSNGNPYLSIVLTPKNKERRNQEPDDATAKPKPAARPAPVPPPASKPVTPDEDDALDDDIPF